MKFQKNNDKIYVRYARQVYLQKGWYKMTEKRILFDKFEFPILKGLEYLLNEKQTNSDYLFVNEINDDFSMYFEKGFPIFDVPKNIERNYCLFELKRPNRIIKFFCPEKKENLNAAVWYFYVELTNEQGEKYVLPGQVRVMFEGAYIKQPKGKPKFIEVLEQVKLQTMVASV